jgi:hypothetical protein
VRPNDAAAIQAITEAHETPSGAAAIFQWWYRAPECFQVLRDGAGVVKGFYLLAEWPGFRGRLPESDPMVRCWRRHLQEQPLEKQEAALFIRRWLSESAGEAPSPVQAACWLDVKRFYLTLRPHVRRCYVAVSDLATYGPPTSQVGFQMVSDGAVSFDGAPLHLAVLDFGPKSIDGWLSRLVGNELGLGRDDSLNPEARELILQGERVRLTALEFGVLRYLRECEGRAVSRAELLERVWQQRPDTGSNVVDVVVRSLRNKLGPRAPAISTVRGIGYLLRSGPEEL